MYLVYKHVRLYLIRYKIEIVYVFKIVSFIDTYELMDGSQVQLSRLALHAKNHYLIMYDLGLTICSLAQSKGGRLIERMTGQSRDGATAEVRNHLAN